MTRQPRSVRLRIRRPAACFSSSTASGQGVAAPGLAALSAFTLLRERVGGTPEGQLGDDDAAEGIALGVEPLPERLEREERQPLVGQELVSQSLGGRTALLAQQRDTRSFEARLENRMQVLHVAAVGEEREDTAPHRDVHVFEEPLEVREVAALGWQRHVGRNERRHLPLEVVARCEAQRPPGSGGEAIEPDRAGEVLERLPRRDSRRGEHDALDTRVQVVDQHLAHVEPLGDELLGVSVTPAIERRRVDQPLVLTVEHGHQARVLLGEPGQQADEVGSALGEVRARLLQQRHELATVGDRRLEALRERGAGGGHRAPRAALARLGGEPELRGVVVRTTRERREVLDEVEERIADRRAARDLVLEAGDHADGCGRVGPAQRAPQVLEQPASAFRDERAEHRRQLDVTRHRS